MSNVNESWQAAHASVAIYRNIGKTLIEKNPHCKALDVGAGIDGWGTTLLKLSLPQRQRMIHLFDPSVRAIHDPDPTLQLVRDPVAEVDTVEWINYAYVLSHVDASEIRPTILRYRHAYPDAVATVLDYTLRGRDEEEAFFLLAQSKAEERELQGMDARKFLEQHMRFTLSDIEAVLHTCGYATEDARHLDNGASRAFLLGKPT